MKNEKAKKYSLLLVAVAFIAVMLAGIDVLFGVDFKESVSWYAQTIHLATHMGAGAVLARLYEWVKT